MIISMRCVLFYTSSSFKEGSISNSFTDGTGEGVASFPVVDFRGVTLAEHQRGAPSMSSQARAKIASSIASVRTPVKVFCCEGW